MSVLGPRPWRPVRRGIAIGVVLACVVVVVLAVVVTRQVGPDDPDADVQRDSVGILGVEMMTMTRSSGPESNEAGLSLRPGSALLLLLPLGGAAVGTGLGRRSRESS